MRRGTVMSNASRYNATITLKLIGLQPIKTPQETLLAEVLYHVVTPTAVSRYRGSRACGAAGHTTYDNRGLTPKVKEIAPSGFLQNVRLVKVTLPPQEENLGQPRF